MKKNKLLILLFFLIFSLQLNAQDSLKKYFQNDKISIGMGGGLDFGGFGYNLIAYPKKGVGIFGGLGFAVAGIGYNAGIKLLLTKNETKSTVPYLIAMYGYNAAVYLKDYDELNKLFYGYSIGIGVDYQPPRRTDSYWSFAILLPFRSSKLAAYESEIINRFGGNFNYMFPVTISIGTRLILNNQKNKKNRHENKL